MLWIPRFPAVIIITDLSSTLEELYTVLVAGSTFVTCLKCVCIQKHVWKPVLSAALCMFLVCLSWYPLHASHACKTYIAPWLILPLCAHAWPPSPTPYAVGAVHEAGLVVQTLRINTISKLTLADSKWLNSLVADFFVCVAFDDVAQPDIVHRYTM